MLNRIWMGMIVIGFAIAIMNGNVELTTKAAIESARTAVDLCIALLGIMCLWTGLMNIAEKGGLTGYVSRAVRPVLKYLYPRVPKGHPALGAVIMNLAANFLGLGNAATPLGIKAMHELQKLNPNKDTATDAMSMFLVMNTSAVQLIPATIIAVRSAAGSSNPAEIIGTIWVASICATIAGIIIAKVLAFFYRKESR